MSEAVETQVQEPKKSKKEVASVTPEPTNAGKLSLSLDELQQIVVAAVAAASQASAATVAAAVVEAKKPTVDPGKEAADAQMRESTRINREREAEAMRLAQEACPHKQGSNALSAFQSPLSSFIVHVLDTGLVVAICTNCLKTIFGDTTDPEERKMLREKSGNHASGSGQRFFRDPLKAQQAGR